MGRTGRLKVFFDGGCRPNPGRIEVAAVARGVVRFVEDLGIGSNADAEWLALIEAYRLAVTATDGPFDLIGDSAYVIALANGRAACRTAAMRAHRDRFMAMAAKRPPARIRWISRNQNLAGIALDRRRGVS